MNVPDPDPFMFLPSATPLIAAGVSMLAASATPWTSTRAKTVQATRYVLVAITILGASAALVRPVHIYGLEATLDALAFFRGDGYSGWAINVGYFGAIIPLMLGYYLLWRFRRDPVSQPEPAPQPF